MKTAQQKWRAKFNSLWRKRAKDKCNGCKCADDAMCACAKWAAENTDNATQAKG